MKRRDFLGSVGAGLTSQFVTFKAWARSKFGYPMSTKEWQQRAATLPYGAYLSSQPKEFDHSLSIPDELGQLLAGKKLYRVGPGILHRGKQHKAMLLDGDGMIREYSFEQNKVQFRSRHIKTPKWVKEKKRGRFAYPSFSQILPGYGMAINTAANIQNQALVTPFKIGKHLFVSDEIQPLTRINPETLEYESEWSLGGDSYFAHAKLDPASETVSLLKFNQMSMTIQVETLDANLKRVSTTEKIDSDSRMVHDWFISENYFVIYLSSFQMSQGDVMKAFFGSIPVCQAFKYSDKRAGKMIIVDRKTGKLVQQFPVKRGHAWHVVNSYEKGSYLYLDFLFDENPDSPAQYETPYYQLYSSEKALPGKEMTTKFVRYEINVKHGSMVINEDMGGEALEMPHVPNHLVGRKYKFFYAFKGKSFIPTKVSKMNRSSGEEQVYDFGPHQYCCEPLFLKTGENGEDDGLLAVDVHDGNTKTNRLVLLDAKDITKGPIYEGPMPFGLPLSFHGFVDQ